MTQKLWGRIVAAVAGAAAMVTLASAPAAAETTGAVPTGASISAASDGGVVIANDVLDIGWTHRNGNTIVGYGSIRPPYSGTATIYLERERWYGWEEVKRATVVGSGYDQYVYYDCSGTGIYNYRARIVAQNGNTVHSKTSNIIRESC